MVLETIEMEGVIMLQFSVNARWMAALTMSAFVGAVFFAQPSFRASIVTNIANASTILFLLIMFSFVVLFLPVTESAG